MAYLYHIVPSKMKGNKLYPLNKLKNKFPEIYKKEIKKYEWRKGILKRKIPVLNCLWNDVIHLTPVNPLKIKKELEKAGFKMKSFKFYKFNASDFDSENTIIFLYKHELMALDNFEKYDYKKITNLNKVPKKTIDYYKKSIEEGKKPLFFYYVPHILFKGNLKIDNKEIINV